MIREFALQMLRKLQFKPVNGHTEPRKKQDEVEDVIMEDDSATKENGVHTEDHDSGKEEAPVVPDTVQALEDDQEESMEDGQAPEEDLVQTPYLPERIELPAQKSQVLQHVELLFALSVKVPEFLEE